MPTGYTAGVEDGTITEFREFALTCARAFMVLIHQREDALSVKPQHREPTDWHRKRLAEARERLESLRRLTEADAEREATTEYEMAVVSWAKRREEQAAKRQRYEDMLTQVKSWQPPTPDHQGLRDFMEQQLTESIRIDLYDPSLPVRQRGAAWLADAYAGVARDLSYHEEEDRKERERCAEANAWIDTLYDSLSPSPVSS
jgi:hypothetical protein